MAPGAETLAKLAGFGNHIRLLKEERRDRQIQEQRHPGGRTIRQQHSIRCVDPRGTLLGERLVGNRRRFVKITRPDGLPTHPCSRPYVDNYPEWYPPYDQPPQITRCPGPHPPHYPPYPPLYPGYPPYHSLGSDESGFSLMNDHLEESLWDDTDSLGTSIFQPYNRRRSYERLPPPYHFDTAPHRHHHHQQHHLHHDPYSAHPFRDLNRTQLPPDLHRTRISHDPHHPRLPAPHIPNANTTLMPAAYPFPPVGGGNRHEHTHGLEEEDNEGDHRSDDSW